MDFSEDEIKEQLNQLGYKNVSTKKLEEFKTGVHAQLTSPPICRPVLRLRGWWVEAFKIFLNSRSGPFFPTLSRYFVIFS